MKKVDCLLRKAKQTRSKLFSATSLIVERGEKFVLLFDLWDGKLGGGKRIESVHDTNEAARAEYSALLADYPPNPRHEPVLIDITFPKDGEI